VNCEIVDLALVIAFTKACVPVVRVAAAGVEAYCSLFESSRLALHARESAAVVEDEVVPGVLSERNKDCVPRHPQREDHRERRLISNILRVFRHSFHNRQRLRTELP
jgi:hypothetical protein